MYYKGTEAECKAYDQMVTEGEKYPIKGDNWANTIEVPSLNCYAIIKHDNYISEMEILDVLPIIENELPN